MGAQRELLEETNLQGSVSNLLGTCSHFNTVFGDILLIGMEVQIVDWSTLKAGDDAEEAIWSLNASDNYAKLKFCFRRGLSRGLSPREF